MWSSWRYVQIDKESKRNLDSFVVRHGVQEN